MITIDSKFKVGDEVVIGDVDPEYVKVVPGYGKLKGKRGKVTYVFFTSNSANGIYYKVMLNKTSEGLDFKENELSLAGCEITGVLSIAGDI